MTKAIRIHGHGGPEVLTYEDVDPGKPAAGQALVRHTAIGLNFLDTYFRTGLYPPPAGLPLIPGSEAAGVVLEVGEGVDWLKPGDRVAYSVQIGAYAEERVIAADRLVKLPDGISAEQVEIASEHRDDPGSEVALSAYDRKRRPDVMARTGAVNLLNLSLLSNIIPAQLLRSAGLSALGAFSPLRSLFMREGLHPGSGFRGFASALREKVRRQ